MDHALKQKSLKALLPYILLCAVLAAVLLGVSGKGLYLMARGPVSLSAQAPEEWKGEYLSFDASQVIVAVASLTNQSDSGTKTLETYYLLPAGDGTYVAVVDKKEQNADILEKAMEQSHEYYLGDLEALTSLGLLRGTASALDADMPAYMEDCIEKYTLPGYTEGGDTAALIRPLQINLQRVGLLSGTLTLVFGGVGLFFLLLGLVLLILALTGVFQKQAKALIAQWNTPEEADQLYMEAQQIERIRVGSYIWYQKGAFTKVLKTSDLIWGYPEPEPLVVSKYRWPVALFDREKRKTLLSFMDKKDGQKLLAAIADQGHPFVAEYTSAISQQFLNDPEGFLALAEETAKTSR